MLFSLSSASENDSRETLLTLFSIMGVSRETNVTLPTVGMGLWTPEISANGVGEK